MVQGHDEEMLLITTSYAEYAEGVSDARPILVMICHKALSYNSVPCLPRNAGLD